jgi:hypothetical protein
MKLIVATTAALLLALSTVSVASAGPASGTTELVGGVAHANTPVNVLVSITSEAPVVPYEYAIVNECWFSGRAAGRADSYERFDLIGPFFDGPGDAVETTVTVNLNPVPSGAVCKVFIAKGNTAVKGSTTQYTVVP